MIEHVEAELPGLLLGELDAQRAADIGRHLATCAECRTELAEITTGIAAMRTAARFGNASIELPPLRLVPAPAPRAPGIPATEAAPRPWWRLARVPFVAAAATLAALLVVAGMVLVPLRTSPPVASGPGVELVGLNGVTAAGEAHMLGSGAGQEMDIIVTGLPPAPDGTYYQVWLIDGQRTLAVGLMTPGGGRFPLPAALVGGYQAIDVSIQPATGDPVHSGDSILRGSLV